MPRMEQQWRAQSQMHSFPFLHAMDHQMAMPSTFHHLGLETGGAEVSTGKMMERDQEYPIRAMYGDVTAQQASYYSSSTTAGNL
uniref:Uncharacterized protein n=1 Tax=Arundo donax TaxID=35708 RepID=A0A0A9B3N9_ARUDO